MMKTMSKKGISKTWVTVIIVVVVVVAAIAGVLYYHNVTATHQKPIVIYELVSYAGNVYFKIMINGTEYAVNQLQKEGVPVKLVVLDADNDLQTQIGQIQTAITAGANVILINPVAPSAEVPYLEQAEQKGITVITLDRDTPTPSARLCYIGSNNTALGIMDAEALIYFLRMSGKQPPWKVVVIEGPPETGVGLMRNNAILSVLEPFVNNGTIQIVSEQNGQFSDSVAFSIMQSVISATGGKIDAVITANGLEAEGAARALMSAGIPIGLHGVIITAIDFTPDVAQAIESGQILATAGQAPFIMGYWGVWIAYYHITKGYNPPSVIITPQAVVTANNITQAYNILQSPVNLADYVPGAPPTPTS